MRIVSVMMTVFLMFFSMGCESDSNSGGTTTTSSGTTTSNISFSITAVTDATISTLYTSDDINVTGISGTASVTLSNGTLLKNSAVVTVNTDGTTTTTMVDGDILAIRLTSSTSYETEVTATLTVGGVSHAFSVTTTTSNQPSSFTFTSVTGATPGETKTSNTITVSGLDDNTTVNGSFNDGGNTADVYLNGSMPSSDSSFTVENGDELYITLDAGSYGTSLSATLTLGATSTSFTVTTMSAPSLSINNGASAINLSYANTVTLTTTITPSTVDGNVTWSSDDTTVASVDSSSGEVTARGEGTATITATVDLDSPHGTATDTISVVVDMDAVINKVNLTPLIPVGNSDVVIDTDMTVAYVSAYLAGVKVVDINTSSNDYNTTVATYEFTDYINSSGAQLKLTSDDQTLFATAQEGGFDIVDVSTPSSPTLISNYNSDYNSSAKTALGITLSTHEKIAYVTGNFGIDVFDVNTPTSISRLDEHNMSGGTGYDFVVNNSNTYGYLAFGAGGVQVINLDDHTALTTIGTGYTTCTDARSLALSGTTLFVACGSEGVHILQTSDDNTTLTALSTYTGSGGSINALDVSFAKNANILYVANGTNGVLALDVSNTASPVLFATYTSTSAIDIKAVKVTSDEAYIYASDEVNGLLKLQLTYE